MIIFILISHLTCGDMFPPNHSYSYEICRSEKVMRLKAELIKTEPTPMNTSHVFEYYKVDLKNMTVEKLGGLGE